MNETTVNLEQRILETLRFFNLQGLPLTLLELHRYLLADPNISEYIDEHGELERVPQEKSDTVSLGLLLALLDVLVSKQRVEEDLGYYALAGSKEKIHIRWRGYYYGVVREHLIWKFVRGLGCIPFVRGAAIAGSQAIGLAKPTSDIDLLIITDPKFLWFTRILVTGFFHVLGVRRYGEFITNRFCLNHYVAGAIVLHGGRNFYTAMEYGKLRPVVGEAIIREFQMVNLPWMQALFPNLPLYIAHPKRVVHRPPVQQVLEAAGNNFLGKFLEQKLQKFQIARIKIQKYIVVNEHELSFHPHSKQTQLLADFF